METNTVAQAAVQSADCRGMKAEAGENDRNMHILATQVVVHGPHGVISAWQLVGHAGSRPRSRPPESESGS